MKETVKGRHKKGSVQVDPEDLRVTEVPHKKFHRTFLEAGDHITKVGKNEVSNYNELKLALESVPGDEVQMTAERNSDALFLFKKVLAVWGHESDPFNTLNFRRSTEWATSAPDEDGAVGVENINTGSYVNYEKGDGRHLLRGSNISENYLCPTTCAFRDIFSASSPLAGKTFKRTVIPEGANVTVLKIDQAYTSENPLMVPQSELAVPPQYLLGGKPIPKYRPFAAVLPQSQKPTYNLNCTLLEACTIAARYSEPFNVPSDIIVATPPYSYRLNGAIRENFSMADSPVVLKIPEGAEFIGKDAFKGCTKVTILELPASLKRIDSGAFEECNNLRTIRFFGPPPEIHDDAFDYYSTVTLVQCPEGYSEEYKKISDKFFDDAPVIPKLRIRRKQKAKKRKGKDGMDYARKRPAAEKKITLSSPLEKKFVQVNPEWWQPMFTRYTNLERPHIYGEDAVVLCHHLLHNVWRGHEIHVLSEESALKLKGKMTTEEAEKMRAGLIGTDELQERVAKIFIPEDYLEDLMRKKGYTDPISLSPITDIDPGDCVRLVYENGRLSKQRFERSSVSQWLQHNNQECPVTRQYVIGLMPDPQYVLNAEKENKKIRFIAADFISTSDPYALELASRPGLKKKGRRYERAGSEPRDFKPGSSPGITIALMRDLTLCDLSTILE